MGEGKVLGQNNPVVPGCVDAQDRAPSKVWLVWASQGEYSDRSEWPICAFWSEDAAKDECFRLLAVWREADKTCRTEDGQIDYEIDDWWSKRNAALPPGLGSLSETEPSFYACEIELRDAASDGAPLRATHGQQPQSDLNNKKPLP